MLYVTKSNPSHEQVRTARTVSGHINDAVFKTYLRESFQNVASIQADGDELERCCAILGRELPPTRVYTFLSINAQEIAANWY